MSAAVFLLALFSRSDWLDYGTRWVLQEVIEMFSLTTLDEVDRDLPRCLWDWTPPRHDLAEGAVHRDECLEYSFEKMKGPNKGMKSCQCPVLRKGKRTVGYFSAPECL